MALKHVMGNVPVIRMLDFIIGSPYTDHTKGEIEEQAGVRPVDMKRDFPNLLGNNLVVETRRIRGEPLFMLNKENYITQAMIEFNDVLNAPSPEAPPEVVVEPEGPDLYECDVGYIPPPSAPDV